MMYCSNCGTEAALGDKFCGVCGMSLQGVESSTAFKEASAPTGSMANESLVQAQTHVAATSHFAAVLHLWNPSVAASWSVLLSAAFGAYLYAANWRQLGNAKRARANMAWFWVEILICLWRWWCRVVPTSALAHGMVLPALLGLGVLIGWYFFEGRLQIKYVKEMAGKSYSKRSWWAPLALGVVGNIMYVLIFAVLSPAVFN